VFCIANNSTKDLLPASQNTTRRWIVDVFHDKKPVIKALLKTARSRVSISFDGWLANNHREYLGVVFHFIDKTGELRTLLVGLQLLTSKHGVTQAAALLSILQDYGIDALNMGYFVTDNATNNDTTLEALAKSIPFNVKERRLRCMGHIYNLVSQAILYGEDIRGFEHEVHDAMKDELQLLRIWRKRGAVGQLHNIVWWICRSPKRIALFESIQSELNLLDVDSEKHIYRLVKDGGIRWHSTYMMIVRATKLRSALEVFCTRALDLDDDRDNALNPLRDGDALKTQDWNDLTEMRDILEPIYFQTKELEGHATLTRGGSHGALWESMIAFERLLEHMEAKKREYDGRHDSTAGLAIEFGWQILNKYYAATDKSPLWIAAVVMHPRWKWNFFELKWANEAGWIRDGRAAVKGLWERRYKNTVPILPISQTQLEHNSSFQNWMADLEMQMDTNVTDELDNYLSLPRDPAISNPLQWWKEHEQTFPNLSKLAYDLLAVPAMSSECERAFSRAGYSMDPRRTTMGDELIEAGECTKSWCLQGVVTLTAGINLPEELQSDGE
jgi:hypothetical protein